MFIFSDYYLKKKKSKHTLTYKCNLIFLMKYFRISSFQANNMVINYHCTTYSVRTTYVFKEH